MTPLVGLCCTIAMFSAASISSVDSDSPIDLAHHASTLDVEHDRQPVGGVAITPASGSALAAGGWGRWDRLRRHGRAIWPDILPRAATICQRRRTACRVGGRIEDPGVSMQ